MLGACILLVVFAPGCASRPPEAETITVEGTVRMEGAEPFAAEVLETEADNLYVLEIPDALREGFRTHVPVRVTGTLHRPEPGNAPYARIRVTAWEPVDR